MRVPTPSRVRRNEAGKALAFALFATLVLVGATTHAASQPEIRIVVNAENPGLRIKRSSVRAIFLDAEPRWADGTLVEAIDQPTRSTARAAFTSRLLGMSVGQFQAHWLRQTLETAGRVRPPKTKDDDAAVLAFVREHPRAIGYVSSDVALDTGVKTLGIVD